MPKPKGTCGATKMKILAIIDHQNTLGEESYGYCIWKNLKENFFLYMNDSDIRNVYHHLNDLCKLNFLSKDDDDMMGGKCLYWLTSEGESLRGRYSKYLTILKRSSNSSF